MALSDNLVDVIHEKILLSDFIGRKMTLVKKGNDFLGNAFGATLLNPNSFAAVFGRYVVLSNTSEFPTHSPISWFLDTGSESATCNGSGTGLPNGGNDICFPCDPPPPIIITS